MRIIRKCLNWLIYGHMWIPNYDQSQHTRTLSYKEKDWECQLFDNKFKAVWFMVFNATFNNISVISWRSALFVEETGAQAQSHQPVASHWQTLSHNVVSSTPHQEWGSNSKALVVIGTDYTGSCKSNYHTIATMTTWTTIRVTILGHLTVKKKTQNTNNLIINLWSI